MALSAQAKAVNTAAAALEAALGTFMAGLVAADRRHYWLWFSEKWPGVTAGANLNAKFPDVATRVVKPPLVAIPIQTATATNANIIWAIESLNIGRIPFTLRITNAAGEVSYT